MENLEGILYRLFTTSMGYSAKEVEVSCAQIRADIKDPKMHAMIHV